MRTTISIPPGLAYGADESVPDTSGGMSVDDAIYHTVHDYPGGVAALAARMGVPANTLTHKANPNNATHYLRPGELVKVQHMSGNAAVLHCMAEQLGFTVARAIPDQSGGDPVQAIMQMHCALGDFMRAVADPLAPLQSGADVGAGRYVTPNEMRRATNMAADLHATIGNVLATLRGRMRPAPTSE